MYDIVACYSITHVPETGAVCRDEKLPNLPLSS